MLAEPLSSIEIPVVETARLRLRGHTMADYAHVCELWADGEVVRHTVGKPQTPEEVWSRILRLLGLWSLFGYGYWVLEEKTTGAFVGEVGVCNLRRAIEPPLEDVPEIGWILLPAHHGKGYATEAAKAVLEWAAGPAVEAKRIACILHTENQASLRVALKCGFVPSYVATYKDAPTLVLYADLSPQA